MKEILIPLNFTPNPVVYDTEQSFSTADASSAVLAFSTTEPLSGVVASLTIKNISQNANITTVLIDRIEVNTSPFRYTFVKPLASGEYYGEIILKRNLEAIGSAQFTFGVNSSLAAEVLPHLIQAYSLDDLVEQVEAEINNLKAAYNLNVESAEDRISTKETTITGKESIRALNETQRKANELTRIAQELARVASEGDRQETFTTLVDSAVIEQVVVQEVAEKYQELEATNSTEMVSFRQQLEQTNADLQAGMGALTADAEVVTARNSTVKGKTFSVIDARFEEIESETDTGIKNIVSNSEFNGTTGWSAYLGTNAVASGELTFTPTAITGSHGPNQVLPVAANGDKIFSVMEVYSAKSGQVVYHHFYGATRNTITTVAGSWVKSTALATVTDATQFMFAAYRQAANVSDLTDVFKVKKPLLINLTKVFGAGNEPTKEEMEALLSKITGNWWSGTLKNNILLRANQELQRANTQLLTSKANQSEVDTIDKTLFKASNLVTNGNFASTTSGWTIFNATQAITNGELVLNVSAQYGSATKTLPFITAMRGHQVFFRAKVKASYSNVNFSLIDTVATNLAPVGGGDYEILSGIKTVSSTATTLSLRIQDIKATDRMPIYLDDVMAIDLTETFGDNIPTIIEMNEFINSLDNDYVDVETSAMSMKDLYNSHLNFRNEVNMNSLPFIMPSFKSPRRPMVSITFDDESVNIYDHAFPVFKSENVPGTFFVVPSRIGTGKLFDWGIADTWSRIKEMDKSGVMKIECHSYAHNYLPSFTRTALENDFNNSIKLFRRQGIAIKHLSYPGGYYNDLVQQVSQQYFQSARTTGRDPVASYQGHTYDVKPYAIDAMGMDGNLSYLKGKVDMALANNCWIELFGHSIHPDGFVTGVGNVVRTCLTPAELTELIQYAKTKGVEVVSVDEALQTYAPIFCWIDDQANAPMVIKRDGTIAYNVIGHAPFLMP